ncbi:coiled-coil domain-containing protein [Nocardiopsis sp. LOL_012]|uniref:coiled-coil domain-containing protein n=1 Tax=Nocardiopsis sp. LOL_012 TaxID=3345409 RepID=UPI003A83B2AA
MTRTSGPSFGAPVPRRRKRARLGALTLCAALLGTLPQAAQAEPGDGEEEEVDIEELRARAEELEETYDGELLQFTEISDRAEAAQEDLAEVEEELDEVRPSVARIAHSQYTSSGVDPTLEIVFSSEPERLVEDASTAQKVTASQAERIADLVQLQEERQVIAEEAEQELTEAEELIETLEEERDEVEARIEEWELAQVPQPAPAGSIPASKQGWGFYGATNTMAAIRDAVILDVGVPYEVGCARNSADDHGVGKACDFMTAPIGSYSSGSGEASGNAIAQWAIDNADRYNVKYVIWKQRIWHSTNRQWVYMNDRGSVTENHYDHVHISSY